MHSADTSHQPKYRIAYSYLQGLVVLSLCLICFPSSTSLGQSGRNQSPSKSETPASTGPESEKSEKKVPSPAFIVVTAAPDISKTLGHQAGSYQPLKLEYQARGGCLLELRRMPGAKVVEDEDVARWEARETALAEDTAWVIWMELRWDKTISTYDPTQFRLRYLLFEPRTGRIVDSGVGKGVKQTWGKPQSRYTSLEEQVRQAGRDIATQVMSELKRRQ